MNLGRTFFFLLFLTFHLCSGQIPANISLGSGITAGSNDSWLSPSADFAFGFYSLPTGEYLVGIWFNRIQERTLVWSANRDNPADRGSTVRLTFGGQLLLTYSNGSVQTIYTGAAASLGFMQNEGDFVLRDSNSVAIWRSFDHPTDTIIPGQVLVQGMKLFSNYKGTVNRSTGDFMLEMQYDGNLVLSAYHFSDPGYWYTGTLTNNVSLVFNQTTASMYLVNGTGDRIYDLTTNITLPLEEYYHRATIDDHGNFQQYAYNKNNGSQWIRVWKAVSEPCTVNSVCGVYGICSSNNNETVNCECLPGYVPLNSEDSSKGCRPETVVNDCADPSTSNFRIAVIDDADLPFEGFADLSRVRNTDLEGCKKALMDDCYTTAAALVGTTCNMKRMPLLNARKAALTRGSKALIKIPMKNDTDSGTQGKKKSNTRAHLQAGLITSSALALLFGVAAIYYHPAPRRVLMRRKRLHDPTEIGINFREFTYKELQEATDGFRRPIGSGASGKVYAGILNLKDIQVEIAVKKLEKVSPRRTEEFMTELKIIGRTYHKNLVRLLGFCIEGDHYILVYELMKNGTLSDFLFTAEIPPWNLRSEMAMAIAKGLLYLHEECETQIIHCDMKPQNVLLDSKFVAKIADFGLSKLLKKDQTRTVTNARGTAGYIAPEWLRNGPVTAKVDIYSLGVMILEIACARRHIDPSRVEEESEDEELVIQDWVLSCVRSGRVEELAREDPDVIDDLKRFERVVLVGLWCVHPDPVLRPSMKTVMQMLQGTIEVGIPPLVNHE